MDSPLLAPFNERHAHFIAIFGTVNVAFAVINIAFALKKRKTVDDDASVRRRFLRTAIAMKLLAIPMFCANFYYGVLNAAIGVPFIVTFAYVLLTVVVAYSTLLVSTCYSVPLIFYAVKTRTIASFRCSILILSQFLFVADVVGLLVFRRDVRRVREAHSN
jgi:hypothetical protein